MYALDALSSRIAAQYQDLALEWLPRIQQQYRTTIRPAVAESFTVLFDRLPPFDPRDIVAFCQHIYHRTVHFSHLFISQWIDTDALPANLVFAALSLTLGLILTLFFSLRRRRPRSTGTHDLYEPLFALMTVMAPATSVWPANYLHIARRGLRSRTLAVPLRALYDDFVSGNLELRTPAIDLPDLMANMHTTQGWRVELNAGAAWWLPLLLQITLARCAALIPQARPALPMLQEHPRLSDSVDAPRSNLGLQERSPALSGTCLLQSAATDGRATLILDAVPYSRVRAYIRAFQLSLPCGAPAMFGFSTLGPSVSCFSSSFVFAAVPFLPRKYITKRRLSSDHRRPHPTACRTVAPLMTSLDYIMKTLTSGPAPLVIESVQNVSDEYAAYLRQYVQDLTDDPSVRARFIARWDIEGWREERFLATWEESLCRAGLLSRWVVLARK